MGVNGWINTLVPASWVVLITAWTTEEMWVYAIAAILAAVTFVLMVTRGPER